MPRPIFECQNKSGNYVDLSKWVKEITIVHEELDSEDSGRDKKTGTMKRTYITTKHTLSVKMVDHLPQSIAHLVHEVTYSRSGTKATFNVKWYSPCSDSGPVTMEMYCSTVNYGSQRYNRIRNEVYYDGVSFNVIQV